jgi:signal transduction histidine kinase
MRLAQQAITALAYFALGRLGLLLAIPPGDASPIWPAAGVAIAAVLVFGYRIWPGLLLGAFAVNISPSFDASTTAELARPAGIALLMGAGATVQAFFGGWLVRRFVSRDEPFDRYGQVLACQALGGPLGCVISPTVGITSLCAIGIVPWSGFVMGWLTWWTGDAIGVLVALPLVMMWMSRAIGCDRRRLMLVGLPLVIVILTTGLCFFQVRESDWRTTRVRFDRRAHELAGQLRQELGWHLDELHAIAGLYRASERVERDEFAAFVGPRLALTSSIKALEWIPAVPHEERLVFEAAARHEGLENFELTERRDQRVMVRAAERPEYYPVYFVEPLAGNEAALGYDLGSSAPRRAALERARDSGEAVATRRIGLVQEMSSQTGFLVFVPVYKGVDAPATVAERRERLAGFVLGVFRVGDLVGAAVGGMLHDDVQVQRADISDPGEPEVLCAINSPATGLVHDEAAWSTLGGPMAAQHEIEVAGRLWRCSFAPTDQFLAAQRQWGAWIIIVSGFLFCALLGGTLMVVTGRESLIRRLVDEKTRQLQVTNSHLELRNAEMERFTHTVSHDLKSPIVTIEGFAGFLKRDIEQGQLDRVDDFATRILNATRSMRGNIDDLLELSRVGLAAREDAVVDVGDVARTVLADLGSLVAETNAHVTIAEGLPAVRADRTRVKQVLQNLLENGLKYGRSGDESPRVTVAGQVVDGEAHLSVADEGPGIAPEHHERVFGLFKRLDRSCEGTGVGLAIVRRVAELHGGRVWIESRPDEGCTFFVALPAAASSPDAKAA